MMFIYMSLKPSVNDGRLPALSFDILQATFNEIFISWLTHQCTHLCALTCQISWQVPISTVEQ